MAKFIKLTNDFGKPFWVAIAHIAHITPNKSGEWAEDGQRHEASVGTLGELWWKVRETPEQILQMIEEAS